MPDSGEESIDELLGIERSEIFWLLARTDEADRDLKLVGDGEDDAALGCAIELRETEGRDGNDLGKGFSLDHGVLTGCGIQDEHDFVRAFRHFAFDDAIDLPELLHEVELRMEAAGGVDQEHVGVAALGGRERVEDDGAGVGALLVGDDIGADDVAPRLELLDGRGTECVSGGDHHLLALFAIGLRELGDARRLAGAVDANDEDDVGASVRRRALLAPDAPFLAAGLEDGYEFFLQQVADFCGFLDAVLLDAELKVGEDLLRGNDAGISADQEFFQLFPDLVIDLAAIEEAGDVGEPPLAGAFERLLSLFVCLFGALKDAKQRTTSLSGGSLAVVGCRP